jgi:hypothetical protein
MFSLIGFSFVSIYLHSKIGVCVAKPSVAKRTIFPEASLKIPMACIKTTSDTVIPFVVNQLNSFAFLYVVPRIH